MENNPAEIKTGGKDAAGLGSKLYRSLGLKQLGYPVPKHAQTLPYLLGGLAFAAFLILFVSGAYLAQFYNPNQLSSNESVVYLITRAPFGNFARSLHYWSANLVFILVLLHLIRVFLTGSYKHPRELTWLTGVALLFLTATFIFTGTMLSLGQEGVEALQHGSQVGLLLGAPGVWLTGGFTASLPLIGRMYVAHISVLALGFALIILAHFFFIKTQGISPQALPETTAADPETGGSARFTDHLVKLTGVSLLLLALISLLALLFPEPVSGPGSAGAEITKPPWMFLWLYGMEDLFGIRSLIWGPPALFLALAALPFIDRSPYLHWRRRPWIIVYGLVLVVLIFGLSLQTWWAPLKTGAEGLANHRLSEILSAPRAYAHNMPVVSFSPPTAKPGQTVTVSGDGLENAGGYDIILRGLRKTVLLGEGKVASGDDHFDAALALPQDLPADLYTVEVQGAENRRPDVFAVLQLFVSAPPGPEIVGPSNRARYPIPPTEIPWIAGLIVLSGGVGAGLLFLTRPKRDALGE